MNGVHLLQEAPDPGINVHPPLPLLQLEHPELPFLQGHLEGSVQGARHVARLVRVGLEVGTSFV